MPLGLDTRKALPQRNSKPKLPPLLRDYLEYVRGDPEVSGQAPIDYLDRLWRQAKEFAERNGVGCPVRLEEVQALRAALEARMATEQATLPAQATSPAKEATAPIAKGGGPAQRQNFASPVIWFERLGSSDVSRVGGKNASIGEMIGNLAAKGLNVPPGFAITADAYRRFIEDNELKHVIASALDDLAQGKGRSPR